MLCAFAPWRDLCGANQPTRSIACVHRASIHISTLLPPPPPRSRVRVTVWASCQSLLVKLSEEGDRLARLESAGHGTGGGEEAGWQKSGHMKWTVGCLHHAFQGDISEARRLAASPTNKVYGAAHASQAAFLPYTAQLLGTRFECVHSPTDRPMTTFADG